MSLLQLIAKRDVADRIKQLRPKLKRKIPTAVQVGARSKRYSLIGTAFDYLIRFELQRLAPHAVVYPWVAESVPRLIWRQTDSGSVGRDLLFDVEPSAYLSPQEVARAMRQILDDAKSTLHEYIPLAMPGLSIRSRLAAHTIRLAKMDSVYRALRLEPQFQEADPDDVEELLELLTLVPFDQLLDPGTMLLNPHFDETSSLVGGADTDLVTGDLLVDFKTTQKTDIEGHWLDQLFGYFLLARKHQRSRTTFPEIRRAGIYCSRHGYLWAFPVSLWVEHIEFPEIEEWFWRIAAESYPQK